MNELYYIRLLQGELRNYREKSPEVIQCSCPVCGDSRTDSWKARFYFLYDKNERHYYVNCHNCNYSNSFKWFLRGEFPTVFKSYMMEEFKEKIKDRETVDDKIDKVISKTNKIDISSLEGKVLLSKHAQSLKSITDKETIDYCKERCFTDKHYEELYFVEDFGKFNRLMGSDKRYWQGNDKRIIIPFFEGGVLIGWQGRAIDRNNKKKYITVSMGISDNLLFGVDDIVESKTIFVTEGALDALFLDNTIAVNGLNKFDNEFTQYHKNNVILILDNEKRNQAVSNEIKRLLDKGFSVYYNDGDLIGKDINDYFINNDITKEELQKTIRENATKGLMGKLNYIRYLKS